MSRMIYRLQTDKRWCEGKQIVKTPFKKIPCDALIVSDEDAVSLCSGDWYEDPNELIAKLEEVKQEMLEAEKTKSKQAPRAKTKSKEDPAVNI